MIRLYAPVAYWQADEATSASVVGGCGPGGVGDWLVPDIIWGLNVKPACRIHDWMYYFGECNADKKAADRSFRNNMVRLIAGTPARRTTVRIRLWLAERYYKAVKKYGGPAFWDNKNDKSEMGEVENG